MFPSVRDVTISGERVRSIVNEMIGRFREIAVMRTLVKPVVLDKNDNRYAEEFFSIVINQVMDRIWFVDGVFKGSSYSFQGIGRNMLRELVKLNPRSYCRVFLRNAAPANSCLKALLNQVTYFARWSCLMNP